MIVKIVFDTFYLRLLRLINANNLRLKINVLGFAHICTHLDTFGHIWTHLQGFARILFNKMKYYGKGFESLNCRNEYKPFCVNFYLIYQYREDFKRVILSCLSFYFLELILKKNIFSLLHI